MKGQVYIRDFCGEINYFVVVGTFSDGGTQFNKYSDDWHLVGTEIRHTIGILVKTNCVIKRIRK